MAKQDINIGVEGNDGTGDSIRESFKKTNENFTELYAVFGLGGSITFKSLSDTPETLTPGTILGSDATGTNVLNLELASNSALGSGPEFEDTIGFDTTSVPGKVIFKVNKTQILLDTNPKLGGHLDAAGRAIGGVGISQSKADALSDQQGLIGNDRYNVDDLVITRGYADQRYITSSPELRVASEPATVTQYTKTIEQYVNGNVQITSHGFDSGDNGLAFTFNAEDTDPTNLVSGTTYYIRYATDDQLSLFTEANKAYATDEDDSVAQTNKVNITGAIAADDTHTIVDSFYDPLLAGNFLSNVALPRDSIVRRQGDTMEGALYLNDHPGDLAGDGTPNGEEDLQAATKYYVDNTSYSSPEVLFVSTKGDDRMFGVPSGKEGTSYTYAYKTINAAAARAEEQIKTAAFELGPYRQTMTYNGGANNAETFTVGVESPAAANVRASQIITANKDYIIKEATGFIDFTYPDFAYNVDRCELDLQLVLQAVALDIQRGDTANYLTRLAAERYFSSSSGRKAITTQKTQTLALYNFVKDLTDSQLEQVYYQQKQISSITKVAGGTPVSKITLASTHGLVDGNRIQFHLNTDPSASPGMTQIQDVIVYVKATGLATNELELYTDKALTTPYDNSSFTNFVDESGAGYPSYIAVRYQDKEEQVIDGAAAGLTQQSSVENLFTLLTTIITSGIEAGTGIVYGKRYQLVVDAGATSGSPASYLDQTNPTNLDVIPGKVVRGKISGAIGQIIEVTNNAPVSGRVTITLNLLEPFDFVAGEELIYANIVKKKQVTIMVESGIYEEDFPIRLSRNCSLKGDEFRRVIIRPKDRISQSKYADTYFFRDATFDGHTLASTGTPFTNQIGVTQGYFGYHYLLDNTEVSNTGTKPDNPGTYGTKAANILKLNKKWIVQEVIEFITATYPSLSYNQSKCERDTGLIVDALVKDLTKGGSENTLEAQGEYYAGAVSGQETETAAAIGYISTLAQALIRANVSGLTIRGTALTQDLTLGADADAETAGDKVGTAIIANALVNLVVFAFNASYNPPLRNDQMDMFLMDDATIIRNVTCQGHGGFMCVLDPAGQILTKSPYIQTASSFSKSENKKTFAGGMYVDAFVGNLPCSVPLTIDPGANASIPGSQSGKVNAFSIWVQSAAGEGLRLRAPQLPAPFYIDGQRYQVNAISDYDSANGWARLYLDSTSNGGNGYNFTGSDIAKDIFIQTAGNRSILANDFTQINDLGYGLVANNSAFSEQVSTFTYYNHAAMYSNNGSEIRALNCSNGYGNFGLVAEGANPNEIPDQVTLEQNMSMPLKAFTTSTFTNATELTTLTAYDAQFKPKNNSVITVDHGGAIGQKRYKISRVTTLSDTDTDGTPGEAGTDVVNTGVATLDPGSVTVSNVSGVATTTYTGVATQGAASGGTGCTLNITFTNGNPNAATVTLNTVGEGYATTDTLTVLNSNIPVATSNLTVDVATIFGTTPASTNGTNRVYRFEIIEDKTFADDFPADIADTITHNTVIEYRDSANFVFDGVADTSGLVTRPSTAINFDESDTETYRSISFSTKDTFNQDLDNVDNDSILTTFDTDFNDVEMIVKKANLTGGYGSASGDTKIAITRIENTRLAQRLFTDGTIQTLRAPGDAGYAGGMIFTYSGKTHRITKYGANDAGQKGEETITGIAKTVVGLVTKLTVTSASHGLSNGQAITIFNNKGMTEVNGLTLYAGNVATNTFDLYTDAGQTAFLDGATFTAHSGSDGYWTLDDADRHYIEFTDVANSDINTPASSAGIATALSATIDKNLFGTLPAGATAEITVAISLLRATGHDFTQIGTGGFNDSNYPKVLFGDPVGGTNAKADFYVDSNDSLKGQVWERRKGRVFFISSDNDGFFRVGKFFSVDQSTGDISFAGEIGISNANSLGFKRGVTINEFSSDDSFADLSGQAVPTEKAIDAYISKRLGYGRTGPQLTGGSRIGPGVLTLDGIPNMEGDLNLGGNKLENVANPTSGSDGANKNYVDDNDKAFDELPNLRNVDIDSTAGGDLFVASGKKKIIVDTASISNGPFSVGDTIEQGGTNGVIVDVKAYTDEIYGSVNEITYTPGSGTFTTGSAVSVDESAPVTSASTVYEADVDEYINAPLLKTGSAGDSTFSDLDVTITRTNSTRNVNIQLTADSIKNADVNSSAGIAQSKTLFNRASTKADSSSLFGLDSSDQGQGYRGLAVFEDDSFAEDITVVLSGAISAAAGDKLIQDGGQEGVVVNTVSGSATVVIRTSVTWVADGTSDISKATLTSGVYGTPASLSVTVTSGGITRSGYISLADRSLPYRAFQTLTGATTGVGGSVIGRASNGSGVAEEVSFATVITQGLGLADGDFNSTIGDVADDGNALTQTGTGAYGITDISTAFASNSIVKRDASGNIAGTALILGGDITYVVADVDGTSLRLKTPGGGVIATSTGATKPTLETGGAVRVGDIGAYSESSFHSASTFGTVGGSGGTVETSAIAARWTYTSFIEAPDEKNATSTGIGIGAGTGFSAGGADIITHVTGGQVRATTSNTGVATDSLTSLTADTNLTLSGNGTGIVTISDSLDVDSIESRSTDTDLTITANGSGKVYINDNLTVSGNTTLGDADTDQVIFGADVHSNILPDATGSNRNLGGSGKIWNTVYATNITSGSNATAGTITGDWTLTSGSTFQATYADLAEYYEGDKEYEAGTVLVFGGDKEVTTITEKGSRRVAGVVSTNPAYTMNAECPGIKICVALQGRVPVKVLGQVRKGDLLVSSAIEGHAIVDNDPKVGTVIGKAVADKLDETRGIVEAVVGRV
jgi:hypothetical protein